MHHFKVESIDDLEPAEVEKPLSWAIEEAMLEEYFLLVRRVPGISLSPSEYWELDTFTTRKLIELEMEIIEKEQEYSNDKPKYTEEHEDNAPEMTALLEELQEDG